MATRADVHDSKVVEIATYSSDNVCDNVDVETISEWNDVFDRYGDCDELCAGIMSMGFDDPSLVQRLAIPAIIERRDCIIQSPSGTGKTGAFTIGTLFRIWNTVKVIDNDDEMRGVLRGVILGSTRMLMVQTYSVIRQLSISMPGFRVGLCMGGSIDENAEIEGKWYNKDKKIGDENYPIMPLRPEDLYRYDIIVATPGKLSDLVKMGAGDSIKKKKKGENAVTFNALAYLMVMVFDEADNLASENFRDQIRTIIGYTPPDCQLCAFSATFTEESVRNYKQVMNQQIPPVVSLKNNSEVPAEKIKHGKVVVCNKNQRFAALVDLLSYVSSTQTIIFVNHKDEAERLCKALAESDYNAGYINGDMTNDQRMIIVEKFKMSVIRILISTDIAARGIDIPKVEVVFNYDLPTDEATYIHRVGRSGRFGKNGLAISFVPDKTNSLRGSEADPMCAGFGDRRIVSDNKLIETISKKYNISIPDLETNFTSWISH